MLYKVKNIALHQTVLLEKWIEKTNDENSIENLIHFFNAKNTIKNIDVKNPFREIQYHWEFSEVPISLLSFYRPDISLWIPECEKNIGYIKVDHKILKQVSEQKQWNLYYLNTESEIQHAVKTKI